MADLRPFRDAIQALLDDTVHKRVAPGLQCVVFKGDKIHFNGVSGFATAPTSDDPQGKPMTPTTILWTASCTKLVTSLVVLHIVDKRLTKTGFSMDDLDNHEALVEILPEFKRGSGSLVTKILEGFEDRLDEHGRRVMKLRDAKGEVTLRMLLTHSAGLGFPWNDELLSEVVGETFNVSRCHFQSQVSQYWPRDGSKPHKNSSIEGAITDFDIPLVHEPGEGYQYVSLDTLLSSLSITPQSSPFQYW